MAVRGVGGVGGKEGEESGDIFHISPLEAHPTPPLTAVFSLRIVDGQKVAICLWSSCPRVRLALVGGLVK